MSDPVISVLMSTYNTPKMWLKESIDSILNQTFCNFEFIIVDDCSSDDLKPDFEAFDDDRIIWIENEKNMGLTKSLNIALKTAKGKYIARMDSDDVALPERFETQVKFMESHPEIIVCGSWRQAFGAESKKEIWNLPKTREEQQAVLFFFNCGLTHPTAMFRHSMLKEYGITYNENYIKAQDYGIWVQCTRYAPMAIIPKILLQYRKSDKQISVAGRANQLECDAMIHCDQLYCIGIEPTEEEKQMHMAFCRGQSYHDGKKLSHWIDRLAAGNRKSGFFDVKAFEKELSGRWYQTCKREYVINGNTTYRQAYQNARTFKYRLSDITNDVKAKLAKLLGR